MVTKLRRLNEHSIFLYSAKKNIRTNKFSNVAGTKSIYKNLLCFYTLEMNYQKENLRKKSQLQRNQKE